MAPAFHIDATATTHRSFLLYGARTARRRFAGTLLVVGLGLGALAPWAPAGDSDESPLSVRLEPRGPALVPKGVPLRYRAVIENPTSDTETVGLTFGLRSAKTGKHVWFRAASSTVAPGETVVAGRVVPAQWFAAGGRYRLSVDSSVGRADGFGFRVLPARTSVPRFRDVTERVGLAAEHHIGTTCNGTHAAGAAWGDADGDGDLDLYLPDQTDPARLWLNDGGTFSERAGAAGVDNGLGEGYGAVFVDFDNDRDQDLYVINKEADRLYENDGSGQFTDIAAGAGVADSLPGTSASWGDYDADGRLDLYLSRWGRCDVEEYLDDVLYHAEPDGSFSDQTALVAATAPTNGRGFIAGWLDYDGDRDLDIYLANDFAVGSNPKPNVLWRNDGPLADGGWTFTDVSDQSGAGVAMNSMGLGIGDYDRDLDLDLAVSNIGATALFENLGGTFEDRASRAGVARPVQRLIDTTTGLAEQASVTWGLAFSDLNNDGWEDLYVASGSMVAGDYLDESPPQPNQVYVNGGGGRFRDLSAPSRADDLGSSRGFALADYDRDGRVDIYLVNRGGEPRLYRNVTPRRGHHWLEVDTVGTISNADGCGATLVARVRDARLLRQVSCGSTSLASGSDATVHLGLGNAGRVRQLRIRWPSGTVQTRKGITADRLITVREPRG